MRRRRDIIRLFALDCDYRNAPNNKYNDWKHTRDSDHGWHS